MSSDLPSYQEATRRTDWWGLVASHIPAREYYRLCLVSRRVYGHFAPRLWNEPLGMARLLGLDSFDELTWYTQTFLARSVKVARRSTRELVLTLDFRDFANATADFLSDEDAEDLTATLRKLPVLFPNIRCVLLDGHPIFNPLAFGLDDTSNTDPPLRLLSIAGGNNLVTELPVSYFKTTAAIFKRLVYLDISYLPGSLSSALAQGSFGHQTLPDLRVLKCRGREVDSASALALAAEFRHQLWSFDVSENSLTDAGLLGLVAMGLPPGLPFVSRSAPGRFSVEGRLVEMKTGVGEVIGSDEYGPFVWIKESEWSGGGKHPQRHLADAPGYQGPMTDGAGDASAAPAAAAAPVVAESWGTATNITTSTTEGMPISNSLRSDGTTPLLRDGPQDMVRTLAGGGGAAPGLVDVLSSRACQGFRGVTHLSVGGNRRLTQRGVERMLRNSGGILEQFDCDLLLMHVWRGGPAWLQERSGTKIYGAIGSSYLVRPVVSMNLRSLRVHHSLVTNVPTITTADDGGTAATILGNWWVAEVYVGPRADVAYPQAFVPDMNPRIESLTLTSIPRRSAGLVVEKLKGFLELCHEQDRMIREAKVSGSRRSPVMLRGLRHLRLEFEPDYYYGLGEDEWVEMDVGWVDGGGDEDVDQPAEGFSFFSEWKPERRSLPSSPEKPAPPLPPRSSKKPEGRSLPSSPEKSSRQDEEPPALPLPPRSSRTGPIPNFPFDVSRWGDVGRTLTHHGNTAHKVRVWVGTGVYDANLHPAVVAYMENLAARNLAKNKGSKLPPWKYWDRDLEKFGLVGPATPGQVGCGVPEGECLFQDAWMAGILNGRIRRPEGRELRGMSDVVAELKLFRQDAREKGRHWTGRLEVVV